MQEIISYVLARETLGGFRDFVNSRSLSAPVLVAQTEYTLKLRLFGNADEMTPYPVQNLAKVRFWQFVLDKDFNHSTTPVVEATHAGIFVHTVQDGDNGYTEVVIPLDNMWTEAIQAFIGTSEVSAELCGELRGFGADNSPQFLLQTKGWKLRNFVADRSATMPQTSTTMKYGYITAADAAGAGMTDVSLVTAALLSSAHMVNASPATALAVSVGTLAAGDWVVIALPVGTPFNTATFADGTEFDLSAGGQNGKLIQVSGDSYLVYGQRIPVAGEVSINIDAYYTSGGGSGGGGYDALIVGALTASTATVLGALSAATFTAGTGGVTLQGGTLFVYGEGFVPSSLSSTTLTVSTVTNGTHSIPFEIPVESSTASSLTLTGDKAFVWDLTGSSSTNTLDTDSGLALGETEKLWSVDIVLGTAGSVQYGLSIDSAGSDALTASKVNRCVVRYDGTTSRLYCYATEDIA